jgi:hypothetical protein
VNRLFVKGVGFWTPGFADSHALAEGKPDAAVTDPSCDLLPARLARRTSVLTRMAIAVTSQAAKEAQLDIARVPTVFASVNGEIDTLHALLDMLYGDGELSPTRFHNSVYNTASGYFSIAAANKSFSTTIVSGAETIAVGLLEAVCLLEEHPTVIVTFAEESTRLPMVLARNPIAAAFALTREAPAEGALSVTLPKRGGPVAVVPAELHENLISPVWALARSLRRRETGVVGLSLDAANPWSTEVIG